MSRPRCVTIGAGRLAGGFVAPMLSAAGWDVVLVSRNPAICTSINLHRGVWLRTTSNPAGDRWFGDIGAASPDDPDLRHLAAGADLFATSVGPSSLQSAGRLLAPLL